MQLRKTPHTSLNILDTGLLLCLLPFLYSNSHTLSPMLLLPKTIVSETFSRTYCLLQQNEQTTHIVMIQKEHFWHQMYLLKDLTKEVARYNHLELRKNNSSQDSEKVNEAIMMKM